jgi:hypothetical protein
MKVLIYTMTIACFSCSSLDAGQFHRPHRHRIHHGYRNTMRHHHDVTKGCHGYSARPVESPVEVQPAPAPAPSPSEVNMCPDGTCRPTTLYPVPVSVLRPIDRLNLRRSRIGLFALVEDPALTVIATRKSALRANRRIVGHDGSPFPGARGEGVGWGMREFTTCYWNTRFHRYAGAATVHDSSGRPYHTLLVR